MIQPTAGLYFGMAGGSWNARTILWIKYISNGSQLAAGCLSTLVGTSMIALGDGGWCLLEIRPFDRSSGALRNDSEYPAR